MCYNFAPSNPQGTVRLQMRQLYKKEYRFIQVPQLLLADLPTKIDVDAQ